jgi:hypothetical protein
MKDQKRFRVSWEVLNAQIAHALSEQFGKEYWVRLPPQAKALYDDDWHASHNETSDEASARQQYQTLSQWEKDGSQPVRNVKIEQAQISWGPT